VRWKEKERDKEKERERERERKRKDRNEQSYFLFLCQGSCFEHANKHKITFHYFFVEKERERFCV
jgi:hypothetical protein